jgi:hypothetical protein
MSILKGLSPGARILVADPAFRTGEVSSVAADPYILDDLDLERQVPLATLRAVIAHAMRRLRPDKSDSWLAPRVHAALRLTRREAADQRTWAYLAVVEFPEYVRWRWANPDDAGTPVPIDRFMGENTANALARLWWVAELTRNGGDYRPTVRALSGFPSLVSWLKLDALHHRAVALAMVDFLASVPAGNSRDRQNQVMARAFNIVSRTLALDALCLSAAQDAEAVREWCAEPVDETTMLKDLPRGPDEPPVPAKEVAAVRAILDRLAVERSPGKSGRRRRTRTSHQTRLNSTISGT